MQSLTSRAAASRGTAAMASPTKAQWGTWFLCLEAAMLGNAGCGFNSVSIPSIAPTTRSGSIVANNGMGGVCGEISTDTTLAADGSLDPLDGKLSGDARFIDAAASDYRLCFDSPCVDTGPQGAPRTGLAGRLRAVDGDLDLLPASDMGALEQQTLSGPLVASIGESIRLLTSGPAGASLSWACPQTP